MSNLSAIYCHEQRELMLESGRVIIVPEPIARSCTGTKDTRFIQAWAVMKQLIPANGQIGYFEAG
ncbi:MAG: hypothetical protein WCY71_10695 [Halothiobacillaceae bacterium]